MTGYYLHILVVLIQESTSKPSKIQISNNNVKKILSITWTEKSTDHCAAKWILTG